MKSYHRWAIALALLLCLLLAGSVWAQTSPHYDLRWHVVASGGREWMAAGNRQASGTLGQLAIGRTQSDSYNLCTGYWCGIRREGFNLYLPIIHKIEEP